MEHNNFMGFSVVLFVRLYFETDVSDESIISLLKVPEIFILILTNLMH